MTPGHHLCTTPAVTNPLYEPLNDVLHKPCIQSALEPESQSSMPPRHDRPSCHVSRHVREPLQAWTNRHGRPVGLGGMAQESRRAGGGRGGRAASTDRGIPDQTAQESGLPDQPCSCPTSAVRPYRSSAAAHTGQRERVPASAHLLSRNPRTRHLAPRTRPETSAGRLGLSRCEWRIAGAVPRSDAWVRAAILGSIMLRVAAIRDTASLACVGRRRNRMEHIRESDVFSREGCARHPIPNTVCPGDGGHAAGLLPRGGRHPGGADDSTRAHGSSGFLNRTQYSCWMGTSSMRA